MIKNLLLFYGGMVSCCCYGNNFSCFCKVSMKKNVMITIVAVAIETMPVTENMVTMETLSLNIWRILSF